MFDHLGRVEGDKEAPEHDFLKMLVTLEITDQDEAFRWKMADTKMKSA